jgi:amino-acid N-acetyltransferase
LRLYPEYNKAELESLMVHPAHEKRGIGTKLVQFIEALAREQGYPQMFCLSTQSFTFFQHKFGYSEGTPDDLPPSRRERYEQSGRKSKILVKNLTAPAATPAAVAVAPNA